MIRFLFKGLIRDRSRSLFPILTVLFGVMLTVLLHCWINGARTEIIEANAKFSTGHLKIMSRAYQTNYDQVPNDLAYIGVNELLDNLKTDYPDVIWSPRIRFGGLIDIPDKNGETRAQGPAAGLAMDLLNQNSPELKFLNIKKAIVRGQMVSKPGEILVSEGFAQTLQIQPGDVATLISSTMYGSMAVANFTVAGTIRFGVTAMDRGAILADISDIQNVLDMNDAAGEIIGFFRDFRYRDSEAIKIANNFNAKYESDDNEFLPIMDTLKNQSGIVELLLMINTFSIAILVIFILAMSIVLWNAGLMGSLRRYGEIGVRLAIGENKGHLYRSLILESLLIGFMGSILGTILGLAISYYLQIKGINISSMMKSASLLISDVMRARVTPLSYVIGFIPGLIATLLGTAISGIGIFRRQTSQLMKELEV